MRRMTLLILFVLPIATACGGGSTTPDGDGGTQAVSDDAAGDLGAAIGGGGGGALIFDGAEHPIESATCQLGDRIDVGTVGEGYRVFVTTSSEGFDVQILDPDSVQWFAQNDTVEVSGSTITGGADTYFNNQSDELIEASFEIECP